MDAKKAVNLLNVEKIATPPDLGTTAIVTAFVNIPPLALGLAWKEILTFTKIARK